MALTLPHHKDPRVRVPVPPNVEAGLMAAKTPHEVAREIALWEEDLARITGHPDVYLDCDEAANLMSDVLKAKGIAHESVVGTSRSGDSHAWIRVEGRNYDPTRQGCSRQFFVAEVWPKE